MAIQLARASRRRVALGPTLSARRSRSPSLNLAFLCLRVLVTGIAFGFGFVAHDALATEATFALGGALVLWVVAAP